MILPVGGMLNINTTTTTAISHKLIPYQPNTCMHNVGISIPCFENIVDPDQLTSDQDLHFPSKQ